MKKQLQLTKTLYDGTDKSAAGKKRNAAYLVALKKHPERYSIAERVLFIDNDA